MLEKNNNNTNTSPSTRKHLSFYNYNNTCGAKIINVLNIWTRKEKINFKQKGEPFSHPERQRRWWVEKTKQVQTFVSFVCEILLIVISH